MTATMTAMKNHYRKLGYTEEKDFPNEYYFMMDPMNFTKVRLYYDGHVLEY